jgi:hypothetical protein
LAFARRRLEPAAGLEPAGGFDRALLDAAHFHPLLLGCFGITETLASIFCDRRRRVDCKGPEPICEWNWVYLPVLPLPWCPLPPVRP